MDYMLLLVNQLLHMLLLEHTKSMHIPKECACFLCLDAVAEAVIVGQVEDIALIAVDELRLGVLAVSPGIVAVVHMDMAVEQIVRLISFQQLPKGLKAPMGKGLFIAAVSHRGVGHNNIHTSASPQAETKFSHPGAHLLFCVLVRPAGIAVASAETCQAQVSVGKDGVFNAQTALRRPLRIVAVMVAMDIDNRGSAHGHKE